MSDAERDIYMGSELRYLTRRPDEPPWRYIEEPAIGQFVADTYREGARVLVVGCGPGNAELALLDSFGVPQEAVTGVEPNHAFAQIAQESYPGSTIIQAKAQEISLEAEQFDIAICNMVFQHLDNAGLRQALQRINSALKPESAFLCIVANPWWVMKTRNLGLAALNSWQDIAYTWHKEAQPFYNRADIDLFDAFVAMGFDIGRFTGDIRFLPMSEAVRADEELYMRGMNPPARLAVIARKR